MASTNNCTGVCMTEMAKATQFCSRHRIQYILSNHIFVLNNSGRICHTNKVSKLETTRSWLHCLTCYYKSEHNCTPQGNRHTTYSLLQSPHSDQQLNVQQTNHPKIRNQIKTTWNLTGFRRRLCLRLLWPLNFWPSQYVPGWGTRVT